MANEQPLSTLQVEHKRLQLYALQDALSCETKPHSKLRRLVNTTVSVGISLAVAHCVTTSTATHIYTPTNKLKTKSLSKKKALLAALNHLVRVQVSYQDDVECAAQCTQKKLTPSMRLEPPAITRIPECLKPEKLHKTEKKLHETYLNEAKKNYSFANIALFAASATTCYIMTSKFLAHKPRSFHATLRSFFYHWEKNLPNIPEELLPLFTTLNTLFKKHNLAAFASEEQARSIMMLLDMEILTLLDTVRN